MTAARSGIYAARNRRTIVEYKRSIRVFYWGAVLAMAAAYFLLMLAQIDLNRKDGLVYDADLLSIIGDHKNSSDLTVVVLGNSRLRYALSWGIDVENPAILPDGRKVWTVQFTRNAENFGAFTSLWPYILAQKPDFIVLQDQILTSARLESRISLTNVSKIIYPYLKNLFNRSDPQTDWNLARRDMSINCLPSPYPVQFIQQFLAFVSRRDRHSLEDSPNIGMARAGIKQALSAGINIAVLHLPPNEEEFAPFSVPLHAIDYHGLGFVPGLKELLPETYRDVFWIDYSNPGKERYCDFTHMNSQGREKFSEWFLSRISEIGVTQVSPNL